MMILSQDGMFAVNSDNVVMFEVKESETLPHETRLCATILIHERRTIQPFYRDVPQPGPHRTCKARAGLHFVQHQHRPQVLCAGSDRR